ncbi:MAG: fimbrillin family protein [Dysgonamonadaceae bacterium]|jgi:hypothetical protein|nr:fimbrillin family protein [Dysgonamonadaceae bacterium]
MKSKKLFFLFTCGILLSCEGNTLDTAAVSQAVQVNAVREGNQIRVTNGMWDAGDAIGLYMKRSGESLSENTLAQNIKYVTSGSANFSPGNDNEKITFPFNASNVDFIGYYPFTTEITGLNYPIDVSDQSDQSAINFLYSNNATGLNAKSPYANMMFTHQLTKIVLNIRPENNSNDLSGLTIKLTNTETNALFSLRDGTLSSPTDHGIISFRVADNGRFAEAIVLPTTNLSGKHLVFEIGGAGYLFPLNSSLNISSFDKSTRYTFNVTLNPHGTSLIAEGSITDWIDGPEEDITLNPEEGGLPDFTKGTKENPFTIDEARVNQGRTNVWVEGYIVGFYTTSARSSFVNNFIGNEGTDASQSNLALAFDVNESVANNTFPIMLGTGTVRNRLNLRANPDNFKKKVIIRGNIGTYMNTIGLRDLIDFEFMDTP